MKKERYKPKVDKLFFILLISTSVLIFAMILPTAIFAPTTLFVTLPVALFTFYFFISALFGYVELREDGLFIKYGFFLKKHIAYGKIRAVEKDRKFYSESMMSLKNSFEHLNIKYNTFDVTTISVTNNDAFAAELEQRISAKESKNGL